MIQTQRQTQKMKTLRTIRHKTRKTKFKYRKKIRPPLALQTEQILNRTKSMVKKTKNRKPKSQRMLILAFLTLCMKTQIFTLSERNPRDRFQGQNRRQLRFNSAWDRKTSQM